MNFDHFFGQIVLVFVTKLHLNRVIQGAADEKLVVEV
jgi:hypothetical protein